MKVIDFAEHKINKNDLTCVQLLILEHEVNIDLYSELRFACQDLINIIDDDQIFSEVEWNFMQYWYKERGFTENDWYYVEACGYEREQFEEEF